MLQKLIGIDAPMALQAIHPHTWEEIEKIGLHRCDPDVELIKEAEQVVKACFKTELMNR